ncbi:hypothetical protein [Streptomyces sp. NPDC008150]|uniref:hypothetical protein n=1 Tax=Streptomyces sp. NPDC008150 TaxID=3364816 RepID=UPI0036E4F0C4
MRLRLQIITWPRRALVLADTPRPDCPDCEGAGGTEWDYGDEQGEYAGTEWEPCGCFTGRTCFLFPLPHRPRVLRRHTNAPDPWGPAT